MQTTQDGYSLVRLLRTASSERHILRLNGVDVATVDLHYLSPTAIDALVVRLDTGQLPDDRLPDLLAAIDRALLPEVESGDAKVHFTVVTGGVTGNFERTDDGTAAV